MKKLKPVYRHLICIGLLVCVLAVTAIVPKQLFTDRPFSSRTSHGEQSGDGTIEMTRGRRADLFERYEEYIRTPQGEMRRFSLAKESFESFDEMLDTLGEEKFAQLTNPLSMLMESFVYDRSQDIIETMGIELVTLFDRDGGTMQVFRFYVEWMGDWRNWVEYISDVDTGDIYCFTASSSLERNAQAYKDIDVLFYNAYDAAEWWADFCDIDMLDTEDINDDLFQLKAKYAEDNDVLTYLVGWKFFGAGSVAEVRFNLQG